MIERQVIVGWYTPEEKLPEQNKFYICTISAKSKSLRFDHVLMNLAWDEDDGWYSMEYDFEELTVHAWCDLEPYGRRRGVRKNDG